MTKTTTTKTTTTTTTTIPLPSTTRPEGFSLRCLLSAVGRSYMRIHPSAPSLKFASL